MDREISLPRDVLESPFPPEAIKSRPGSFGSTLSYLEGHTIIARLNEAFDGAWSFEVVAHEILDEEVLVLGKFRADGAGVVKMAFGGSKITRNERTRQPVSLGDDLKAAATDALKKAGTLLGVGLQLYGAQAGGSAQAEDERPFEDDLRGATPETRNTRNIRNGRDAHETSPGNGTNGNSRITNRQIAAVFAIARERRMSNQDVRNLAKERFGRNLDYLTKAEASSLIEHLLAH